MSTETIAASFGEVLRHYRIAAGFSQDFLAQRARISVESVGALERGARKAPYSSTVALLAAALDLSDAQRVHLEIAAKTARSRRPVVAGCDVAKPLPWFTRGSSLVGREHDLTRISALLEGGRLLTITGAGGVGKTSVALEIAARVARDTNSQVHIVDVGSLHDGGQVAEVLSSIVSANCAGPGHRRTLIVLDGCEHLIADVAVEASALVKAENAIVFLATSRERLAIRGEVVFRLSPLGLPMGYQSSIAEARLYAAFDLFLERARSIEPVALFCDDDAETIAGICRKLDGIPLAIEIAAAQFPSLGLAGLLECLERDLTLSSGSPDLPPRQRTIVAAIEWSYQLLNPTERLLLDRTALFVGRFALEDAEAVCAGNGIERNDVGDILTSLAEKSLLNVELTDNSAFYKPLHVVQSSSRIRLKNSAEWSALHAQFRSWRAVRAERAHLAEVH